MEGKMLIRVELNSFWLINENGSTLRIQQRSQLTIDIEKSYKKENQIAIKIVFY
jgi:hypothetical protein